MNKIMLIIIYYRQEQRLLSCMNIIIYPCFSSYVNLYIIITYNLCAFFFKRLLISLKNLNILNVAQFYVDDNVLLRNICITHNYEWVPIVVITFPFLCLTRVTQCAPWVMQNLLSPPECMYSPRLIVGLVLLDLWFSVNYFVDHPLSFWPLYCLSFELRLLITLWYMHLQAFRTLEY